VLSRDGICVHITARGEAEVKFRSKFPLGAKPRWNLDFNFGLG